MVPDDFSGIREDFRAVSRISLLLVFCFIDAMEDMEIEPRSQKNAPFCSEDYWLSTFGPSNWTMVAPVYEVKV